MSACRTTPTRRSGCVDDRHVPVAARPHQHDRVADRVVEVERLRIGRHERLDRLGQVDPAADDLAEDVALGQHPEQPPGGIADEDRIAGSGALDGAHALGQQGPRQDGHGLAPAQDPQALFGQRRDASDDRGFGDVTHLASVVRRPFAGLLASGRWIVDAPPGSRWYWPRRPVSAPGRCSRSRSITPG